MSTPFKERFEKVKKILADNGEDLHTFLRSIRKYRVDHKYYLNSIRKQKTKNRNIAENRRKIFARIRKYFLNKNYYAFLVDPQIAARFRIVTIAEVISPVILIEAMMQAFIEGDPAFIELMKNINKYHKKPVLKIYKNKFTFRRLEKIKKIREYYNIPPEWWKKYADLKVDELDF